MLDNLGPYRKIRFKIHIINIYQFFFNRMGINKNISNLLCLYSGINKFFKIKKLINFENQNKSYYNNNYLLKKIQFFFIKNKKRIDTFVKKKFSENIEKLVNIKNIKGKLHELKLPVRGQRNRTNGRTQKKIFRMSNIKIHNISINKKTIKKNKKNKKK